MPTLPASWGIRWFTWMNSTILSNQRRLPLYIPRWPLEDIFLKIAANIANVIEDGSCISLGIGPLYEALAVQLATKKNLGVHSPFFTDALMDLVKSGAVTNRHKGVFRGKCAASYLLGSERIDAAGWITIRLSNFSRKM